MIIIIMGCHEDEGCSRVAHLGEQSTGELHAVDSENLVARLQHARAPRLSNDRLNRGFTTDMKCDMAILAHMAVGALEYGAAGDFLALLVALWRAQR